MTYQEYIKSRVVNDEKLASLESVLGRKIPINLLQEAIENHNAEEFMRQYYCKELQQSVTDISLKNLEKIDGTDVVKFDGEKFTMLVSVLGAYNSSDNEFDFRSKENGSKTVAASLITDEFMGHYSNKNKERIVLGYTQIPDNSLYLCGPQDLCSLHDDGSYERRDRIMGVNYMPSRQMAKQTSCVYNEYAMLRKTEQGEEISPTCVISFSLDIDEQIKKFSQKHNLPIVVIDWEQYKKRQLQKLKDIEKKENPTLEEFEDYLFGVVAYCEELICYNLEKENAISWSDCTDKIEDKINALKEKFQIDQNSNYWPVCKKFIDFQQSTRNDAIGRIFSNNIFKQEFQKERQL